MTSDSLVDLRTAAAELGVHYQTAYRWVRSGRLAAQVQRGKYVIDRDDLVRAADEPVRPVATVPSAARIDRQRDRMFEALVTGDERSARTIARRLTDEGTPVIELIESVIAPGLRRIGDQWQSGEVPIWVEHRASAICERILGDVSPNPRGRRRGTAIVAALAPERHALPTTMAAMALRQHNWAVDHLGVDIPRREIELYCRDHAPDLVVLTVTNADAVEASRDFARDLASDGLHTLVGAPGKTLRDLVESAAAL